MEIVKPRFNESLANAIDREPDGLIAAMQANPHSDSWKPPEGIAVLAERERCGRIAEAPEKSAGDVLHVPRGMDPNVYWSGYIAACKNIAGKIWSGE